MMSSAKLTVLGSSSQGNGYLLEVGEDKLILECGVPAKEMLQLLDWKPQGVFALTTHAHFDHSKYIKQYQKFGINVYSNSDVAEKFEKIKVLQPMKRYKIGNFYITALPLEHNVECYGYIIDHSEMGRLIFYTDTKSFNYRVPDVNHILGEVNFSEDIVIDNICNGEEVRSQFNNHMSLDTAIEVVKRLYNPRLSSVLCCHLSDSNSSEKKIYERFKNELGIDVDFCDNGRVFDFKKEDF